jgi:hemerythrin
VASHFGRRLFDPVDPSLVCVGIPQIDAEHRQLVDHYNALLQALDEGEDITAFGLSFYSLIVHMRQHFRHEEALMQDAGYPGLTLHRAQHRKLLANAEDFLSSVLTRFEKYDCTAVAKYFKYWLLDHVTHYDRSFAEFAKAAPHASYPPFRINERAIDLGR